MAEVQIPDPFERQDQSFGRQGRHLGAVALETHSEGSDQESRYPDIEFELDLSGFADRPTIEVTPAARTRQILKIVNEAGTSQLNENFDFRLREEHLRRVNSYLSQRVNVQDEQHQRKYIIDNTGAVANVREKLAAINHPVEQVLSRAEVELKDTLTPGELKGLVIDVLSITHWNDLREEYNQQVSAKR